MVAARGSDPVVRRIETGIVPALTGRSTRPQLLAERMRILKVPGISMALIRHGRVAWTRGWGVRDAGSCAKVDPSTLFQAASISKSVTALLAMRLVEQNRLDLDADIATRLRRWRLPPDGRFASTPVTLRQLLSHTGGIGVHGFAGYLPDGPVPDLIQTLDGLPPANNPAVRLEATPGSGFSYSGGGYMIVQALVEDATGEPFARTARDLVLKPLHMDHSDFAQSLPSAERADASVGHDGGNPFRHGAYVYPELAAAGLWTTPSDLARMLIDVRAATLGPGHIVSPQTAATMLTRVAGDWGLGFELWGTGAERRFGHGGVQLGFLSNAWIYQASGDGIVIMTNGEGGLTLADDVVRAVADELGWRELASRPLTAALAAAPLFVRGSMNGWTPSAMLRPTAPGVWTASLSLRSGDHTFKIASEDWKTLVLGAENQTPATGATNHMASPPGATTSRSPSPPPAPTASRSKTTAPASRG